MNRLLLLTFTILIIASVHGAATHQVTYTLQDGVVTATKLHQMGASTGEVLTYDGTNWVPSDLGNLTYAGTWDASSATAPNASPAAGEYYIVSVAGTSIDLSDGSGSRNFAVGDWLVYNDGTSRWDKFDNATSVTSFNGRNGVITPATNDYTWAQIDKTTSPIGDLSNVNTTGAGVGSVLKYDGSNWVVGTDISTGANTVNSAAITDGSIVDADVNASAAIAQSKIANLTTDLAAKLNLSGGTMTGDLTMGANNIVTSGTVDGVDVSTLSTSVGTNSTNIAANTTAIAGKENAITAAASTTYFRGDKTFVTLNTGVVPESGNLYFTDGRARTAAVVNSTAGSETNQAASVAAMKSYVTASAGPGGDLNNGGNSTGSAITIGTNDSQSLNLETNNSTAVTILSGGNVGVGSTSPRSKLDVNGAINPGAPSVGSTTTINFSGGNLQGTSLSCQTFALWHLKSGATYNFAVQGTSAGTCAFNAFSDGGSTGLTVRMPPDHSAVISGKHTFYSFSVVGSAVYVSWIPGY